MSPQEHGVQRIRAEQLGGAEDGRQYEGMMLTGRPHAVLIVDAQGRPHASAPSGALASPEELLAVLEKAIGALRWEQQP